MACIVNGARLATPRMYGTSRHKERLSCLHYEADPEDIRIVSIMAIALFLLTGLNQPHRVDGSTKSETVMGLVG